jgi:hypothetical protein
MNPKFIWAVICLLRFSLHARTWVDGLFISRKKYLDKFKQFVFVAALLFFYARVLLYIWTTSG